MATAGQINIDAGRRTGDYLLAHRIPRAVQRVLRCVPAPLASRVLLSAIRRLAWTFAGSGTFDATAAPRPRLTIAGNPLCRELQASAPVCAYEHLFRALVHPDATVTEVTCEATGAVACVFEVRW